VGATSFLKRNSSICERVKARRLTGFVLAVLFGANDGDDFLSLLVFS